MTTWKVPLSEVSFGPEEIEAVNRVLESGWISQGPLVEQFEAEFAQFLGTKHAVAVANGTAALHLACLVLGLGSGDEVLCPALTFVATANAILYTGAQPVFVDIIGPHSLNLSPDDAALKVTSRTRAIMVMHYGGYAADMAAIQDLAARHHLAIIEDCAHVPGAAYTSPPGNNKVGSLGTMGCFSFFSNKNMTTGEGGMIVTNDSSLEKSLRMARSHGMTTLTWDRHRGHSFTYDVVARGYNYRLDEIRAALGLVQLSKLEADNARRRELTCLFREKLRELPQVQLPFLSEDVNVSACHLFPILLPVEINRDQFMDFLKARGIQTSIHYPPAHKFSYYQQLWPQGYDHRLTRTEEIAAKEVTLPLYPTLTQNQVEKVTTVIKEFFS